MPVDETARGIDDSLSFSLPYQPILPSEYVRDDDTSRQRIPSVHRRENRRSKHAPNRTGPIYRPTWNLRKKKKKKENESVSRSSEYSSILQFPNTPLSPRKTTFVASASPASYITVLRVSPCLLFEISAEEQREREEGRRGR